MPRFRDQACPCGSGNKVRACHRGQAYSLLPDALPVQMEAVEEGHHLVLLLRYVCQPQNRGAWRRLEVDADHSLDQLHAAIQACFGWTNQHGARFSYGRYFKNRHDPELPTTDLMWAPQPRARVGETVQVLRREVGDARAGVAAIYEYDYGDAHVVAITVEDSRPGSRPHPVVTAGALRAPLDDIGGWPAWDQLWDYQVHRIRCPIDVLQMLWTWAGPEATVWDFDADAINAVLRGDAEPPGAFPKCVNCGDLLSVPYDAWNKVCHFIEDEDGFMGLRWDDEGEHPCKHPVPDREWLRGPMPEIARA